MKKKYFIPALCLAGLLCFGCSLGDNTTNIALSKDGVTVNDEAISENTRQAVYLSSEIETHPDVSEELQDTANSVIHITKAGTYRLSGEMQQAQIRIEAPRQEVHLILDNVSLECQTAPAILIKDAEDTQTAGKAGVSITLADGSTNIVTGSHIAKYTDNTGEKVKNDGAISSNVSLLFDGNGTLQVSGDKEGIESKMHLTINGGAIQVTAQDDCLNASEDGESVITVNDGILNCIVQAGQEGDGIDSNGTIEINGGFIVSQAHSSSQDSGLDSDDGIFINGGTVFATGNMYEEISEESKQAFAQFYFTDTQSGNTPIVLTDAEGNALFGFVPENNYTILAVSSGDLVNGETYQLYQGGTLAGTSTNGVYTQIDSYTGGTPLANRGTSTSGSMGPGGGNPPDNFNQGQPPEPPENNTATTNSTTDIPSESADIQDSASNTVPEKPADGAQPNDAPEPPAEGVQPNQAPPKPGVSYDTNAEQNTSFVLNTKEPIFVGVAPLEA